ncbi:CAMKK/CAMKK-META protein kinase [Cladophialophora yegresii CBS 114405]|uniref:CAMKK/CAMKK-META protein kinase n=1 Tax=Cladophialophora yegresii CBS 114405 TaxID=1182544 RepID=W9VWQ1_9EURO|nr:CAMKK/CAMKK-META protein kinase [Cladophialophora yegresii CBS 114405]EXJ56656.1 CAMKK/CAMKK-META protein kinase [Cladophialophora yegresii CBS 114405]
MDIVASPTSTSAEEGVPLPMSNTQPRDLVQSHGNPGDESTNASTPTKPPIVKHLSSPEYSTPSRHHRRTPSSARQVKESLNARSEYVTSKDDGVAEHRINQYVIKQEIGRGSFGAVHLAIDQYGKEYAVKEFSKARLRKRAQSHILRKPLSQRRRGALQGFNSPLHRGFGNDGDSKSSPINLIKEEIAIMKKLNHPNLVSLIEVLDDPSEDSLYMVLEMCKKGVVMKVGLDERADPYPDHVCRYWFRDLILGIEYLHAQGVVHRDIKPDNCLVTEDDVLKVVDFGVSEMFAKDSEMLTAKSAGSPAFLPPELCVARHGDVSGRAADIWSMGVTLYCLKFGRIPFEKTQIFALYEAIKTEEPNLDEEPNEDFRDLMRRILEKDPQKRIKMRELREHPWVTKKGEDTLLSEEENTSDLVEPPTEAEMNAAITDNMRNLMTVVKAVNKFKALIGKDKSRAITSILGEQGGARFSQPPTSMPTEGTPLPLKSHSFNVFGQERSEESQQIDRISEDVNKLKVRPIPTLSIDDTTKAEESNGGGSGKVPLSHASTAADEAMSRMETIAEIEQLDPDKLPPFRSLKPHAYTIDDTGHKGHAHDPLEDKLYLFIGPSTFSGTSSMTDDDSTFIPSGDGVPIVSESPGAADVDIYETAYRDEIERIMARAKEEQKEPNVYLTRRVDARLMAISGLAGKWAAKGEEAKNQIKDYTQFSTRKARVTEVSRALRQAAREEYERRRQEHREWIAAEKADRAKAKEEDTSRPISSASPPLGAGSEVEEPAGGSPQSPGRHSTMWKGKAVDAGRQARTSLMGFVDLVKSKSRTRSKDEAN